MQDPAATAAVSLRYVRGDDPLMAQVAALCYETLHRPFGVSRNDDWDNMDPDSSHLVALDGSRVVGYGRLITERGWGHLRQIAVDQAYRRRGIGTVLVRELVAAASRMGKRRIYLNARMDATSLYERVGFVRVGGVFPMPRTYLPHVRMELDLR